MRLVFVMLILFYTTICVSQIFDPMPYPKGYFRNPLNIPIDLSGNFGELRPNHYHMGLDLKTQHKENLPVFAAADGYVAKVKIESFGFGRAIYINHPNGYTTVYCHLNAFFPALEAYIKQQQYGLESWSLLLDVPVNLFALRKGDFLAYSGNSGGSQAPHLHFEVRRMSDDANRNPMLFGFPLADNTKPTISRLAVYDRRLSIYEQSPKLLPIKKTGNSYNTAMPVIILNSPKVSFAISASDTHNNSTNANGIFEATIYDNDKAIVGFEMDKISYDDTRSLNAHIDYKTKANGGPYLQQLFKLPGCLHCIYKQFNGDGIIDIKDETVHNIKIEVKDAYNNTTYLQTRVQYKNIGLNPTTVVGKLFYPLIKDGFESDECQFYIDEKCLYDAVHVDYKKVLATAPNAASALHTIGAGYIPLQNNMQVHIKPTITLNKDKQSRTIMHRAVGNKYTVQKVVWQKGWATANFKEMGNFQLLVDEDPPIITPIGFSNGANMSNAIKIIFIIKDSYDEIKNFRATLDGKWLRFTNDKGKKFIYLFDEKCQPGEHNLNISIEDEAGNVATQRYNFTR